MIVVPAGLYKLTIGGSGEDAGLVGDLDVVDDLTITGAAGETTIDGGSLHRVLQVHAPTPGVLPQVTLHPIDSDDHTVIRELRDSGWLAGMLQQLADPI